MANVFNMILQNLWQALATKAGKSRWHIELVLTKAHCVDGQKAGSCHEGVGQWLNHYQNEHCTDESSTTAPLV